MTMVAPNGSRVRGLVHGVRMTVAVVACGATGIAHANPDVDMEPSDGSVQTIVLPKRDSSREVTLGLGAAVRPHFLGADGYQGEPAPLVDVQFGRFFAKSGEGIGLNVIEIGKLRAGVAVNWMQGYDEEDAPKGMDEVKDALGARMFASLRLKGVVATIAGTKAVTESERGLLVNASLAYPLSWHERLTIVPSVGAAWGDDDYMVSYFGVDSSEAVASGLARYQPESGFRDVSFRIAANYAFSKKLSAVAVVGVTHLTGDAAESPIVEKRTQPLGVLGFTYTF